MLKYIRKIPILHSSINENDFNKVLFPAIIGGLLDINLKNSGTGKELTYKDDNFAGAENVKAESNDKIYISYTMDGLENIKITLEIGELYKYSCGIKRIMQYRELEGRYDYGFRGARLNIMDRTSYIDKENPSKYFIDISAEIIMIDANYVVIKDVEYI